MSNPSTENPLTFADQGVSSVFERAFVGAVEYAKAWDELALAETNAAVHTDTVSITRLFSKETPLDMQVSLSTAAVDSILCLRQRSGMISSLDLQEIETVIKIKMGNCYDLEARHAGRFPLDYFVQETIKLKSPYRDGDSRTFEDLARTEYGPIGSLEELQTITDLALSMFKFYGDSIKKPTASAWFDVFGRGQTLLVQPEPLGIQSLGSIDRSRPT